MGIVAVIEPALVWPATHQCWFIHRLFFHAGRLGTFPSPAVRHCASLHDGLNSKERMIPGLPTVLAELPNFVAATLPPSVKLAMTTRLKPKTKVSATNQPRTELNLPIMVHTPHRDKVAGTLRSMDVLEEMGADPRMVVIDHNNEETVQAVLDRGYWAAFTIYPKTKMGNERMVEVVRRYGSKRIIVDSSADWGVSDPLAVPKTANLMRTRAIPEADIAASCYGNALTVYGQSASLTRHLANDENWLINDSYTKVIWCFVVRAHTVESDDDVI